MVAGDSIKQQGLGLWFAYGTRILIKLQAKDPTIIGDSVIIIAEMEVGREFKNQALNKTK